MLRRFFTRENIASDLRADEKLQRETVCAALLPRFQEKNNTHLKLADESHDISLSPLNHAVFQKNTCENERNNSLTYKQQIL